MLEDGENRLSGERGPATEYYCDFFLDEQIAGLLGKSAPIRRGVDDDRLQFPSEQPTFLVLIRDQHEHGVFKDGLADRHVAGQGMQNADLDRVVGGVNGRSGEAQPDRSRSTAMPREIGVPFMSILP